jgi:hypothetical protein
MDMVQILFLISKISILFSVSMYGGSVSFEELIGWLTFDLFMHANSGVLSTVELKL